MDLGMPKTNETPLFTEAEERVLALVGENLPAGPEPYKAVAEQTGTTEQEVLDLVSRLKESGVIRRFGATLRHQKAGYGHNAMVAWRVDQDVSEEVGDYMAARPEISHCYRRRVYPQWPYNLYTMIHGRDPDECRRVVAEIIEATGQSDYAVLNSIRELKKTSMRYF